MRDAISSIFLLSIFLVSRLVGREASFSLSDFDYLFYALSGYLVISLVARGVVTYRSLTLALDDVTYWQDVTRNHMSSQEFSSHVESRTKGYKSLFCISIVIVSVIYIFLAVGVSLIPHVFDKNLEGNVELKTLNQSEVLVDSELKEDLARPEVNASVDAAAAEQVTHDVAGSVEQVAEPLENSKENKNQIAGE